MVCSNLRITRPTPCSTVLNRGPFPVKLRAVKQSIRVVGVCQVVGGGENIGPMSAIPGLPSPSGELLPGDYPVKLISGTLPWCSVVVKWALVRGLWPRPVPA